MSKSGEERVYHSALLRRTYRTEGKVRNETVANLSMLPEHVIDWIEAGLKGRQLVPADQALTITGSLPHGHVAAVWQMAKKLGLPGLLGPACRQRDLVLALIISRVVKPGSKLSTLTWWSDTTLGQDLGVTEASTDAVYAAMDWLEDRQTSIETALARRHLAPRVNPSRMALFDLSSSWMEGSKCELAARGYSRDGKKGKLQIEYGLLTDPHGRPVALRVFEGNTSDPTAFIDAVEAVRTTFGLQHMVMVGDRGMITSARIQALKELNTAGNTAGNNAGNTGDNAGIGWLTALRAPAIKKLAAQDGPLQMSLFDQQDLAEISHPDFPGERLIACRNPFLADERARKRLALLDATQALLDQIAARVAHGRLTGADDIGVAVGKVINKYKVGKHFDYQITDTTLTLQPRQTQIDAEAALDGIYVLRTPVPADELDPAGVVTAYKQLSRVERDFRVIKTDDLDLRPIYHYLHDRVKAHVLICMLAAYLTWHLRLAWAPLTFTDQHPPQRDNPVTPAHRSAAADQKASRQHDPSGRPYHSFRGLLDHLATLTRNQVRYTGATTDLPILAEPTSTQREAFNLIHTTIPLTLQ